MSRLTVRVATVMEAALANLVSPTGMSVEWDASFTAKVCAGQGAIHYEPAVAFYVAVYDARAGRSAMCSSIAEAPFCTDAFVTSVAINLWTKARFNLEMMGADFEGVYDDFEQAIDQGG